MFITTLAEMCEETTISVAGSRVWHALYQLKLNKLTLKSA